MITSEMTGGGCTAYQVTEPDAPRLYALVTETASASIPENPETDSMEIGLYSEDDSDPQGPTIEAEGRKGLIAWYVKNVGHDPDEDQGFPVAILELIDRVASHLLLRKHAELTAAL